jgi:hypothetical protein
LLEGSSVNTAVMVAVLSVAVIAVLGVASAVVRGHPGPGGAADNVPRMNTDNPARKTTDNATHEAELLSDFEVSRAIGVSVEGLPVPGVRPRPGRTETAYHPLRGGDRLLQASVLAGRAGRATLRTYRRRGKPLSHAGDRAYSRTDWVLGQRGDVVVLLRQHGPERWRVIGGLPWLLSTALNRVPASTAGVNQA